MIEKVKEISRKLAEIKETGINFYIVESVKDDGERLFLSNEEFARLLKEDEIEGVKANLLKCFNKYWVSTEYDGLFIFTIIQSKYDVEKMLKGRSDVEWTEE